MVDRNFTSLLPRYLPKDIIGLIHAYIPNYFLIEEIQQMLIDNYAKDISKQIDDFTGRFQHIDVEMVSTTLGREISEQLVEKYKKHLNELFHHKLVNVDNIIDEVIAYVKPGKKVDCNFHNDEFVVYCPFRDCKRDSAHCLIYQKVVDIYLMRLFLGEEKHVRPHITMTHRNLHTFSFQHWLVNTIDCIHYEKTKLKETRTYFYGDLYGNDCYTFVRWAIFQVDNNKPMKDILRDTLC